MRQMKAIVSRLPGGPETLSLEDLPAPQPGEGEVVLGVNVCSVNYPDALIIRDQYQVKPPRPFSPGSEVCGTVLSIGQKVTDLRVGDRVIGRCGWGGMAEMVRIPADRCLKIGPRMPATEAASFLFAYATAYYALKNRAQLQPGETLLVLGAAGGVGSAAVELGRAMGARTLAAASTPSKLEFAKAMGAEGGLVYPPELGADEAKLLSQQFKDLAGPSGIDVVLDPVGGNYSEPALRCLRRNGRHLVVGFTAGIPRIPLNLTLLKSCQIIGVNWYVFNHAESSSSNENSMDLLQLYERQRIRPRVSEVFPLERAHEAIRRLSERGAVGKLVVQVSE